MKIWIRAMSLQGDRMENQDDFVLHTPEWSAVARTPEEDGEGLFCSMDTVIDIGPGDGLIGALFDGMGGSDLGGKASAAAAMAFARTAGTAGLSDCVKACHEAVLELNAEHTAYSTCSAFSIEETELPGGESITVFNGRFLGDSPAYHLRGRDIWQLNETQNGKWLKKVAGVNVGRNEIKSVALYLGLDTDDVEPLCDKIMFPLLPGDTVMMASDGIFDIVPERKIADFCRRFSPAEDINIRKRHARCDNVTVIALTMMEE